ncbi:amylo-alpha-1,6-glucosidase [Sutcliffiella horikoshii]|uniref:Amylo-alpha-1,6-glucosidase n=1 Tax=Sutcliffiella horikoshii TaxID=79883 RepID=A0ABM6KHT2_9BACI|nr:amylo-alpha-1,6-glucosidase [Sutcliffiella horikoshii]ART75922.1 amylo-alpha-1,6-glucosidase [Sutcliffiella horikoshii]
MDYRVIKENDLFILTDTNGNIPEQHPYGLGLYTKDTRFLSKLDVKINGEEPILLHSDAAENYMATILMTNPHMERNGELILWRESVEIKRTRFIYNDVFYESLTVKNYYPKSVNFDLSVHMDVDFADMFIVRGFQNGEIGKRTGQTVDGESFTFHYEGADNLARRTYVEWDKDAYYIDGEKGEVFFQFNLDHEEEQTITFKIQPQHGNEKSVNILSASDALEKLKESYNSWNNSITKVKTDWLPLQRLIDRGLGDLRVLLTDLGYGKFPVAGLPWFGVPFGRDSLIAALQMLAFQPEVAKGTLYTMASKQGTKVDPWRDEQPGKIMHEIRYGELATTEQIPFTPYYGTIDATPLFLILLTEYVKWTGDLKVVEDLKVNIEAALTWIDQYGDRDGDMFVEYHQEASKGIANQGWKDSGDSIVHRNGDYATTPIALSEVQGYVYQAKMGVASIYDKLGDPERAAVLREESTKLKIKFDEEFWMDDVNFYAIALDKNKQQVGTITSNPGHILFSEMLEEDKANAVIETLVSPKMFSGFGIRTMGTGEAGYNPMSYHDGSIWPHDNSMVLLGMSKIQKQGAANVVMEGLIEAAAHFEYDRLPELFCGYDKSVGKAVKYPVACSPQAWAAGTPLVFIQTILGLFPDALEKKIVLSPLLPNGMNELDVEKVKIGEGFLSLSVQKNAEGILELTIIENTTGFDIVQN